MPVDLAVVPVAGLGTRLLPATKSQPKEMLPVGQRPVVQYVVEELANCGVRRVLFVTGPGKTAIENHFDINDDLLTRLREHGQEDLLAKLDFERMQVQYAYTRQARQLGLGHAVLCARPMVSQQPFVVALGDSILGLHASSQAVRRLTEVFEAQQADAVIAFETVPRPEVIRYGIADPGETSGESFTLRGLVEKPAAKDAPSCFAVAGRYVFCAEIFDYLQRTPPGKGGEIQLTDAIAAMIRDGRRVLGVSLLPSERRYDIGNFASYFRAFVDFALSDSEFGPGLEAHLRAKLAAPEPRP